MVVKRKSKPPTPIGKGKKGTLKRAVYTSGGGRKTLKTARSVGKTGRKNITKLDNASDIVRSVRKGRSVQGLQPTTGKSKPRKSQDSRAAAGVADIQSQSRKSGATRKTRTVKRIAERKGISRSAANAIRKSKK